MKDREDEWARLLCAANAGDQAAYARFLETLAPVLRAAARRGLARVALPQADAEDIVQETLLAIHLKRHSYDPARPVMAWVQAIARYKLVDAMRRRAGARQIPIDDVVESLAAEATEPAPQAGDVERHVAALSSRQREVVRAIAIEGRSIGEAAARLSLSEGAVRVALHRGLRTLAARLKD